ncbi:MAG: peroxidase family protein [Chromatiales bacterium]|nr:peroxidase family protein [Chromatiales bacterium]
MIVTRILKHSTLLAALGLSIAASAQIVPEGADMLREADGNAPNPGVSPVLRIQRMPAAPADLNLRSAIRSIDGSGNHPMDPTIGAAGTPLHRFAASDYGDGISTLAGSSRLGAREISNIVAAQDSSRVNARGASDFLWQWGQFLDHDLDLTDGTDPPESADISVPVGDPFFDPDATGSATIPFNRSLYAAESGVDADTPRIQVNEITGWIDASNVYGSDDARARALRTLDGTGRLKTSAGNLLPFNVDGLSNAGGTSDALFVAGDVRANEQVGLTVMHTLFVREHNRQADRIRAGNRFLNDEAIYQRARRMVGALMQSITYNEFLPLLLGPDALGPYEGYVMEVDGAIRNEFSTAAYRFGHSALSPQILRLDARGREIAEGHLPLRDAFFSPSRLTDEGGIEPLLRGLAMQRCQEIDPFVVDDVRNFLFGAPGAGGFDLASLNIQRGRDHGLPTYNDMREAMGLARKASFDEISDDPRVRARLAEAYASVDEVDLWVGGLAETHVEGAMVGELVRTILSAQFEALRMGDRFWYERVLTRMELDEVRSTTLADVIRNNTAIRGELRDDVFLVPVRNPPGPPPRP